MGDIVLLNLGDICPADILILDSADNKLFVDTSLIDGLSYKIPKIPLKSTYGEKEYYFIN